jgi:glucokinase
VTDRPEPNSIAKAKRPFFLGVDLGGTNVKFGLVDDDGNTLAKVSMPTESPRGPEDCARRMGERALALIVEAGAAPDDVPRVGLATPGTMDVPAGLMLQPHNFPGWSNFPIRDRLSHHCGKPVAYVNDANAAAYGEFWKGSGAEYASMILLTLGTGVGGGILVDQQLIDGAHSTGGEVGHIIIDYHDDARLCPCGQRGHLEAYASGPSVVRRTEEALEAGGKSSISDRLEQGAELTPLVVAQEAEAGDALCLEIVLNTAKYLGVGVVTLIHTIDPDGVVLGGAVTFGGVKSKLGRRFLARLKEEVAARAFPVLAERVAIDFAALGSDAGYIGAAGVARAQFHAGAR